jgi:hypothetical protein
VAVVLVLAFELVGDWCLIALALALALDLFFLLILCVATLTADELHTMSGINR